MSFSRLLSPLTISSSSASASSSSSSSSSSSLSLSHRIVMAPLTRVRADEQFVCGPTAVQYYSERATPGGLLITEGAPISPETQYEYAAGIYTPEQEAGWKKVVDAVHAKGGLISIQLWHLGRMVHNSWSQNPFLRETAAARAKKYNFNVALPSVSASATTPPGLTRDYVLNKRGVPYTTARALTKEEIVGRLVNDYKLAAEASLRCGFDFIELHSAHGYLFDQFFCSSTNLRTDEFGTQSIENRTRALSLVLDAVIRVYGASRVGIRISPVYKDTFAYQGCKDADPETTYKGVVKHLDKFKLGYLLLTEPRWNGGRGNVDVATDSTFSLSVRHSWVRSVYSGVIIGSSSFTPSTAEAALKAGLYDAIAFGRFFISTPDLVERIRRNQTLNVYNTATFYVRDPVVGYVDYPTYSSRGNFPQIADDEIGAKKEIPAKL